MFRKHHYLSADFNKASEMFLIYWENTLVGMCSVLPMPCGTSKYSFRQHRLVILPDYQGLGIGSKINDFMGNYYINNGNKYFIRTTHVRLNRHMKNSPNWKETNQSGKIRSKSDIERNIKNSFMSGDQRIAGSFEYVGSDYTNKEHQHIICIGDTDIEKATNILDKIIDKNKYPIIITGITDQSNITSWEEYARKRGIRTEVLSVKKNGVFSYVKRHFSKDFDLIITDEELLKDIDCTYMKNKYSIN